MTLAVESLATDSPMVTIRDAISQSIAQCMREEIPEGYDVQNKQEWCAAKAYSMARERTGQSLGEGTQR